MKLITPTTTKMATLKSSNIILNTQIFSSSNYSSHKRGLIVKATLNITKADIISPQNPLNLQNYTQNSPTISVTKNVNTNEADPLIMEKLYILLEAVLDRVEMHKNVKDQREDWNSLLLTSINAITLTAATMAGVAIFTPEGGAPMMAMKFSSASMYVAVTGMLAIMNKIQPSQLAEEQRNATRLFKQLEGEIRTMMLIGSPTAFDVEEMMEKVLALDEAYPLPLLGGVMLEKFPKNVEPAVWWPEHRRRKALKGNKGWNKKLEEEMRQIVNVIRTKDKEEYLRLGDKALKLNKFLSTTGPVLTGLAAMGSSFVGNYPWAVVVAVMGGALASVVNTLEHGGQVGMVFEMYRNNAGFFEHMEEKIGSTLDNEELDIRGNGEVFEMKVGLRLGRSLSELRELAVVAAAASGKGEGVGEFASKLF